MVRTTEPIRAVNSYNVALEPAAPFWVLDYVSKDTERKDYEKSFHKNDRELKVPYYLTFYPDTQDLTLYRHNGREYLTVKPMAEGRYALPELDLEVGLLEGWVRFWQHGELFPLPADLQRDLNATRRQLDAVTRRADELMRRLAAADGELAALRGQRKN